jgi:Protein of unknown function (DUF2577)
LSSGKLEGNGAGRFIQLMRQHGHNTDVDVELATVLTPPPALTIKLDNDGIVLDKDDLLVAQHLTKYKRHFTIRKSTDGNFASKVKLGSSSVTESMSTQGYNPHTHDIYSLALDNVQNDLTFENVEVEFLDEIKPEDRVIVLAIKDGQQYVILDRAVTY